MLFSSAAAFMLAAGIMLLGFAVHPEILEAVDRALRDLAVMVFEADSDLWPDEPLTPALRAGLGIVGALLVFMSGAAMA